jgi:hypothetical protein
LTRRGGKVLSVRPVFDAGSVIDGCVLIRIATVGDDIELEFDARSCSLLLLGILSYANPFQSKGSAGTLSDAPLVPICGS